MLKVIFSFLAILSFANTVQAATFCVVSAGISPQCLYDDVAQCQKNAGANSACTVNPLSKLTYSGNMNYCVVRNSSFAECNYIDRSQCNDEARRGKAICVENPNTKKTGSEMYDYDSRIQR